MNFRRPARFVSITTAALTVFMLFPAIWSAAARDGGFVPLICSFAVGVAAASALYLAGSAAPGGMDTREAILSVTGAWIFASALTGLPYIFSGTLPRYLDALFEGVSGFTTTGATVIADLESVPRGILLWRALSQWVGGVGIVVFALAFFPMAGAARLYKEEITGPFLERLTPRIRGTATFLCKMYLVLTLSHILLLIAGGLDIFDSLTLAFSTAATGGFLPYSDNAGHFASGYVRLVTALFLFLSAMNLALFHAVIVKRSLSPMRENPELRFYASLFLSFGAAISLILYRSGAYGSLTEPLSDGFFHTASMLATCGFFTTDYNAWPNSARMLMLILMFCGGCAASTAGGIKCGRVVIVMRHIGAEFTRRLHPRAIVPTRIGGNAIDAGVISSCFSYFAAYFGIFTVGLALLGFFGEGITTSISGVAATLGNVGPGFGMAGPGQGYAAMPDGVKIVYIALMLCGRLEIFTLLILFTPRFWRG